jgi:hypothetical protein
VVDDKMNMRPIFACLLGASTIPLAVLPNCKSLSMPTPTQIEAGIGVEKSVCSFIEGIDTDGATRNICATVDEVAEMVAFIANFLRPTLQDAGLTNAQCSNLPGTTFCATSVEKARGITLIIKSRAARLSVTHPSN